MSKSMAHSFLSEQPLQGTAAKNQKKPNFTFNGSGYLGIQLDLRPAEWDQGYF